MTYNNLLKKVSLILIPSFLIILYGVYSYVSYTNEKKNYKLQIIEYKDVRDLPDKYTIEMAKNMGDIVIGKDKSYNQNRLDKFIENVKNDSPDKVQIVKYTEEGYPLIEQLYYTGESLSLITDNTRQKDILNDYREINTYKVKSIEKELKLDGFLYKANLEDGRTFDIAFFKNNN